MVIICKIYNNNQGREIMLILSYKQYDIANIVRYRLFCEIFYKNNQMHYNKSIADKRNDNFENL